MADHGGSETTPLLPPGALARSHSHPETSTPTSTTSDQQRSPPTRPKPPRTVTFNANPVSETFEAEPHYNYHHQSRSASTSAASASLRNSQLHPIHTSMSSAPSPSLSSALSGGTPVLSSLNSKLRRRNSHGSMPASYSNSMSPGGVMRFAPGTSFPGGMMPKVGPQRSTKNAQKLKLLPNPDPTGDDDGTDVDADDDTGRDVYSQYTRIKDPSARRDAARLGKADRERLPRVTAYCTANKYQMDGLMRFLKGRGKTRGASPKLIDECIYTPYNYNHAIAGGDEASNGNGNGWRSQMGRRRSRDDAAETVGENRGAEGESLPEPTPNLSDDLRGDPLAAYGKQLLAEANEQTPLLPVDHANLHSQDSGYVEGFSQDETQPSTVADRPQTPERTADTNGANNDVSNDNPFSPRYSDESAMLDGSPMSPEMHRSPDQHESALVPSATAVNGDYFDTEVHTPEVFLFDYGVVVIWGMSETQEEKFLKELERFEVEKLALDEVQTELFNFYYTREYQPRIYNDFITLRDKNNYRTKLAISHGLAQSVKTSLFEELVATTIETTKDIPSEIALTGSIALTRSEINMQIGELFILRINIHQSGSVLDTPELFWVEPQLEPVYKAVRSYLEMDRRVKVLTSRLEVIGDLLAVLKDQLSHGHGEKLEWIVIFLIAAEILVAAINIYVDLFIVD